MNPKSGFKRNVCSAAVMAVCAGNCLAIEINTESGWSGSLNTKISVGANWRAEDPEKALVGIKMAGYRNDYANVGQYAGYYSGNSTTPNPDIAANMAGNPGSLGRTAGTGGRGPNTTPAGFADIGNLNYAKGDLYSATAKVISELSLSKGDIAFLLRAKAWYDYAANDLNVPYGNRAAWNDAGSGRGPGLGPSWDKPLSDSGAPRLSRFDGVALMDAYVSYNFDAGTMPAQVRVGRQVINWGEGIFTRGVSQLAPLDVTAVRRAGSELKEVLLPTLALSGNIGLPGGMSLEGVYQLKWEPSVVENCGSFWNMGHGTVGPDAGACNLFLAIGGTPQTLNVNGALGQVLVNQGKGKTPDDAGAWGLAFRFPVESIDTEVSLYAMNVASTLPVLRGTGPVASSLTGLLSSTTVGKPVSVSLDYLDNIRIYGISAATNLAGISFGAELSRQENVPISYNSKDFEGALGTPNSPISAVASRQFIGTPAGTVVNFNGYELHDKTQLIINGVASLGDFAKMMNATTGTLVAEVGVEWNDVPDYKKPGAVRFGRNGSGQANFHTISGLLNANGIGGLAQADRCIGATGFQQKACNNDGFVTDFSWGYRVRGSLTYSQIFGTSWSASPSIFFSHDVDGVSMDGQYQEGRQTVSLGLEFDLNKEHTISLGYTNLSGKWNTLRDHDNYSLSYSYNF